MKEVSVSDILRGERCYELTGQIPVPDWGKALDVIDSVGGRWEKTLHFKAFSGRYKIVYRFIRQDAPLIEHYYTHGINRKPRKHQSPN